MRIGLVHVVVFAAAFLIGCVVVYYSPIEHKTIFVYPTPSNVGNLQFKDRTGSCFHFTAKETPCTGAEEQIPQAV